MSVGQFIVKLSAISLTLIDPIDFFCQILLKNYLFFDMKIRYEALYIEIQLFKLASIN